MRAGVTISIGLHAALLVAGMIYLPRAVREFDVVAVVPIELVTIGDITNVRAARPDPVPPPPEPESRPDTPEPEPVVQAAPPPPPEPEPETRAAPEVIAPDPTTPDVSEPAPEAEQQPPPPEPRTRPQPPRTEQPRPPAQRQPDVDLDYLSGLVDQARRDQAPDRGTPEVGERREAVGAGTAMTATLSAMLYSQIQRCYRSSADAPGADQLQVGYNVRLNRDGSLAEPPDLVDAARVNASSNPYLRVMAERARRAVIECAPYRMPPENFNEWRLLTVNFRSSP